MNRRSFLAGSLTLAGLGLTGCPSKSAPEPLRGSRRDPSFSEGHRLRTKEFPQAVSSQQEQDVVVLGGGVSGLSAAWRLKAAGVKKFRLLELEPSVGGNSRALEYPTTPAPIGAHYLPLPNTEAKAVRRVLQEMGVLEERNGKLELDTRHLCHSREERLYYQGHWWSGLHPERIFSDEGRTQFEDFQEKILEWRGRRDKRGRKIFALPVFYSSDEPEYTALDRISFAEYCAQQNWNDPLLVWYLNYACRDDFGGTMETCSAWAGLHYFASRDGGDLGDADDILVWPEGNFRLVKHLSDRVGDVVTSQALVIAVENLEGGGVQVDYLDTKTDTRHRVLAKAAVYCLPTFTRRLILEEAAREAFVYPPWLSANLSLKRTPKDLEAPGNIAWDNVIYGSESLGYVVATHQNLALDQTGPTVWTWYRPFAEGDAVENRKRLLDATWEQWAETILSELEPLHSDIRSLCEQLDVTILGHGMIRPSVDFLWSDAMKAAREPVGQIFFGHGDLSGMSLFEESQFRGVLAAERALDSMGLVTPSFL